MQSQNDVQLLLVPVAIECSAKERLFLKSTVSFLTQIGFDFDEWSGGTFVIRACPSILNKENLAKIFKDFLDEMASMQEGTAKAPLPERILKSWACKAAVKFGMPLAAAEQKELLRELEKTPNNSTCPHGRPTRVTVTFDELERRFYRRK